MEQYAEQNLAFTVFNAAEKTPNAIALIENNQQWTYQQLARRIQQRIKALKQHNIEAETHVGLLFYNTIDYVTNFFALLSLKAVVVPINVRLTAVEISRIIDHSHMKALMSDHSFSGVLKQIKTQHPDLAVLMPELLESSEAHCNDVFPAPIEKNALATLVYTSGTTGEPKGVMLSHHNIWADALANIEVIHGKNNDRFITVSPLFHVFGQANVLVTAMALGATLVLMEKFSPKKLLSLIEGHRVTILTAVPTMYQMILTHLKEKKYDVSSVRVCHSGAAAMPVDLIEKIENAFDAPVQEGYGLSEATSMVTSNPLTGPRKPGTVGPAIPGVEIQVWDAENNPTINNIGEVMVRGAIVMLGYYENVSATESKIINDWLKTGDLGTLDTDGYLTIASRKDDLINVGGVNVYPKEIELVLRQHPTIEEVVVTGRPSHLYHQEVWAFIVLKTDAEKPSNEALHQFCEPYLAKFKIPKHFEWRKDLPKTASGKIQRNKL